MSKKIYVRQIEPGNQESPVMQEGKNWQGTWLEDLVVAGNPCFREHTIPEYDLWEEKKYELREELKERPDCMIEILEDLELTTRDQLDAQIFSWLSLKKDILDGVRFNQYSENLTANVLTIMTGKPYSCTMIHGCVQAEWNVLYYPTDAWGREAVRDFEAQYFNTGSEWLVHEEAYEPEDPSEISGSTVYITNDWNDEEIKKSLSEVLGCDPAELVIYKFDGYKRTPLFRCVK